MKIMIQLQSCSSTQCGVPLKLMCSHPQPRALFIPETSYYVAWREGINIAYERNSHSSNQKNQMGLCVGRR